VLRTGALVTVSRNAVTGPSLARSAFDTEMFSVRDQFGWAVT